MVRPYLCGLRCVGRERVEGLLQRNYAGQGQGPTPELERGDPSTQCQCKRDWVLVGSDSLPCIVARVVRGCRPCELDCRKEGFGGEAPEVGEGRTEVEKGEGPVLGGDEEVCVTVEDFWRESGIGVELHMH
ncbi:hypothetical protein CRG98_009443 [Punica granatum]|uniref:Uncharacterized protein n=1 Tax=Punica granatum TaxID=22663 RepID=A0A2I0KNU1_PUNGR|nr:hypothetical protein CRG98_009443 [Punica granatum]